MLIGGVPATKITSSNISQTANVQVTLNFSDTVSNQALQNTAFDLSTLNITLAQQRP